MKLFAHVNEEQNSDYRKKIWDQILVVVNLSESDAELLNFEEKIEGQSNKVAGRPKRDSPVTRVKSNMAKFLLYFKERWMNDYQIKLSEERTNNICESYHAKLWREIN